LAATPFLRERFEDLVGQLEETLSSFGARLNEKGRTAL